jgi:stage III sporulation protein AB
MDIIREIQGFLMELENEIHFMGRPLGQALLSISHNKVNRLAAFSKKVSELHGKGNLTIEAAWQKSLGVFREQWALHEEEWSLLYSIGEVLGKTDRTSQSSFIKMMREKFSIQEKKADEDRMKKEKLYKNLGALGGVALVLVLI